MATVVTVRGRAISLAELEKTKISLAEAAEILEAMESMQADIRYLDTAKLSQVAEMIAKDHSLAEISAATGIPLEVEMENESKLVLREEVTSFGTWLGQRDATLKEVPATEFTLPEDLKGCGNAKRNIVVAHQRGDLVVGTYADYLDQRYAVGDMTFRRNLVPLVATFARLSDNDFSFMVHHAYESLNGSGGVPGAMWLRVIHIVMTAYENLQTAAAEMRQAFKAHDAAGLDAAMSTASWVNQARVNNIRQMAGLIRDGNKVAAQRLPAQIAAFLEEVEALCSGDVEEFFFALTDQKLVHPMLDRYQPSEDSASLEREAREWLKERGLARQTAILLTHVIWALSSGEVALLEDCLEERASGSRDWETPLLEAQLGEGL